MAINMYKGKSGLAVAFLLYWHKKEKINFNLKCVHLIFNIGFLMVLQKRKLNIKTIMDHKTIHESQDKL